MLTLAFVAPYYHKFVNDRRWINGISFALLLWVIIILPATVNHSIMFSISGNTIIYSAIYSLLLAVSLVSGIFAPVLDDIHNIMVGILVAGIGYFLTITPIRLLLNISTIPSILLFQLSIILIFSIFLVFFYFYHNKKLLAMALFITFYNTLLSTIASVKVSSLFNLVWESTAIFAVFWVLYFMYANNIFIKKLLKSHKNIYYNSKKLKKSDIVVIVIVALLCVGAFGNIYTHTVVGDPTDSMYPVITPGSLIIVTHIQASQINVGDIIEFKAVFDNNTLYVHQVINITVINGTYYFETKGINNAVPDPKLTPQQDVVGIVVFHVPYVGYIIIFGQIVAILSVTVIIILLLFTPQKRKRIKIRKY